MGWTGVRASPRRGWRNKNNAIRSRMRPPWTMATALAGPLEQKCSVKTTWTMVQAVPTAITVEHSKLKASNTPDQPMSHNNTWIGTSYLDFSPDRRANWHMHKKSINLCTKRNLSKIEKGFTQREGTYSSKASLLSPIRCILFTCTWIRS